jgi:hypoxanthine phosphoribosyltransferase
VIVAIARGGLVPATIISHWLGIYDLRTISIKRKEHDGRNALSLSVPEVVRSVEMGELTGRRVLIVDDIVTTGATMEAAKHLVLASEIAEVRTATLVAKIAVNERQTTAERPTDHVGVTCSGWVVFPWEATRDDT